MLEFSLLGSGSAGNALLVRTPDTQILVDCGLSMRQAMARAAAQGCDLTHEHGDHVQSVGTLSRKLGIPVFVTEATARALPQRLGALPDVRYFEAGEQLTWRDLTLDSFSVSHDAVDPVSFVVGSRGARLGLATDLGHVSHLVRARLAGVHALVLESNYCPDMLLNGDYPATVQARIRSRWGHLSNQSSAALLSAIAHAALRTVVLIHISENNNSAEKAYRLARQALGLHAAALMLAAQDAPTPLIEVAA